ncbi:hypothetical protein [Lactococcus fujiensis]|nr:hypothetical protein [Lactococcus fujiensis]
MKKMLNRDWLVLSVNVGLFFYAMTLSIQYLSQYDNIFSKFLITFFSNISFFYYNTKVAVTDWRNIAFIGLLLIILFLLIRFWRLTFVLLEVITLFFIAAYAYLIVSHITGFEQILPFIVLIISLINIWLISHHLNLM